MPHRKGLTINIEATIQAANDEEERYYPKAASSYGAGPSPQSATGGASSQLLHTSPPYMHQSGGAPVTRSPSHPYQQRSAADGRASPFMSIAGGAHTAAQGQQLASGSATALLLSARNSQSSNNGLLPPSAAGINSGRNLASPFTSPHSSGGRAGVGVPYPASTTTRHPQHFDPNNAPVGLGAHHRPGSFRQQMGSASSASPAPIVLSPHQHAAQSATVGGGRPGGHRPHFVSIAVGDQPSPRGTPSLAPFPIPQQRPPSVASDALALSGRPLAAGVGTVSSYAAVDAAGPNNLSVDAADTTLPRCLNCVTSPTSPRDANAQSVGFGNNSGSVLATPPIVGGSGSLSAGVGVGASDGFHHRHVVAGVAALSPTHRSSPSAANLSANRSGAFVGTSSRGPSYPLPSPRPAAAASSSLPSSGHPAEEEGNPLFSLSFLTAGGGGVPNRFGGGPGINAAGTGRANSSSSSFPRRGSSSRGVGMTHSGDAFGHNSFCAGDGSAHITNGGLGLPTAAVGTHCSPHVCYCAVDDSNPTAPQVCTTLRQQQHRRVMSGSSAGLFGSQYSSHGARTEPSPSHAKEAAGVGVGGYHYLVGGNPHSFERRLTGCSSSQQPSDSSNLQHCPSGPYGGSSSEAGRHTFVVSPPPAGASSSAATYHFDAHHHDPHHSGANGAPLNSNSVGGGFYATDHLFRSDTYNTYNVHVPPQPRDVARHCPSGAANNYQHYYRHPSGGGLSSQHSSPQQLPMMAFAGYGGFANQFPLSSPLARAGAPQLKEMRARSFLKAAAGSNSFSTAGTSGAGRSGGKKRARKTDSIGGEDGRGAADEVEGDNANSTASGIGRTLDSFHTTNGGEVRSSSSGEENHSDDGEEEEYPPQRPAGFLEGRGYFDRFFFLETGEPAFAEVAVIGKGAGGFVRKAQHRLTNRVLAIKEIRCINVAQLDQTRGEIQQLYDAVSAYENAEAMRGLLAAAEGGGEYLYGYDEQPLQHHCAFMQHEEGCEIGGDPHAHLHQHPSSSECAGSQPQMVGGGTQKTPVITVADNCQAAVNQVDGQTPLSGYDEATSSHEHAPLASVEESDPTAAALLSGTSALSDPHSGGAGGPALMLPRQQHPQLAAVTSNSSVVTTVNSSSVVAVSATTAAETNTMMLASLTTNECLASASFTFCSQPWSGTTPQRGHHHHNVRGHHGRFSPSGAGMGMGASLPPLPPSSVATAPAATTIASATGAAAHQRLDEATAAIAIASASSWGTPLELAAAADEAAATDEANTFANAAVGASLPPMAPTATAATTVEGQTLYQRFLALQEQPIPSLHSVSVMNGVVESDSINYKALRQQAYAQLAPPPQSPAVVSAPSGRTQFGAAAAAVAKSDNASPHKPAAAVAGSTDDNDNATSPPRCSTLSLAERFLSGNNSGGDSSGHSKPHHAQQKIHSGLSAGENADSAGLHLAAVAACNSGSGQFHAQHAHSLETTPTVRASADVSPSAAALRHQQASFPLSMSQPYVRADSSGGDSRQTLPSEVANNSSTNVATAAGGSQPNSAVLPPQPALRGPSAAAAAQTASGSGRATTNRHDSNSNVSHGYNSAQSLTNTANNSSGRSLNNGGSKPQLLSTAAASHCATTVAPALLPAADAAPNGAVALWAAADGASPGGSPSLPSAAAFTADAEMIRNPKQLTINVAKAASSSQLRPQQTKEGTPSTRSSPTAQQQQHLITPQSAATAGQKPPLSPTTTPHQQQQAHHHTSPIASNASGTVVAPTSPLMARLSPTAAMAAAKAALVAQYVQQSELPPHYPPLSLATTPGDDNAADIAAISSDVAAAIAVPAAECSVVGDDAGSISSKTRTSTAGDDATTVSGTTAAGQHNQATLVVAAETPALAATARTVSSSASSRNKQPASDEAKTAAVKATPAAAEQNDNATTHFAALVSISSPLGESDEAEGEKEGAGDIVRRYATGGSGSVSSSERLERERVTQLLAEASLPSIMLNPLFAASPFIVRCYAVTVHDQSMFVAMELLDGCLDTVRRRAVRAAAAKAAHNSVLHTETEGTRLLLSSLNSQPSAGDRGVETAHSPGNSQSLMGAFGNSASGGPAPPAIAPIPEPILASFAFDLLSGLDYLHRERRIVHRDIKPPNILFCAASGEAKIADFGICTSLGPGTGGIGRRPRRNRRRATVAPSEAASPHHGHHNSESDDDDSGSGDGRPRSGGGAAPLMSVVSPSNHDRNSFVGTVSYMSPERLTGRPYDASSDVWSAGITILELAIGAHPFHYYFNRSRQARLRTLPAAQTAPSAAAATAGGNAGNSGSLQRVTSALGSRSTLRSDTAVAATAVSSPITPADSAVALPTVVQTIQTEEGVGAAKDAAAAALLPPEKRVVAVVSTIAQQQELAVAEAFAAVDCGSASALPMLSLVPTPDDSEERHPSAGGTENDGFSVAEGNHNRNAHIDLSPEEAAAASSAAGSQRTDTGPAALFNSSFADGTIVLAVAAPSPAASSTAAAIVAPPMPYESGCGAITRGSAGGGGGGVMGSASQPNSSTVTSFACDANAVVSSATPCSSSNNARASDAPTVTTAVTTGSSCSKRGVGVADDNDNANSVVSADSTAPVSSGKPEVALRKAPPALSIGIGVPSHVSPPLSPTAPAASVPPSGADSSAHASIGVVPPSIVAPMASLSSSPSAACGAVPSVLQPSSSSVSAVSGGATAAPAAAVSLGLSSPPSCPPSPPPPAIAAQPPQQPTKTLSSNLASGLTVEAKFWILYGHLAPQAPLDIPTLIARGRGITEETEAETEERRRRRRSVRQREGAAPKANAVPNASAELPAHDLCCFAAGTSVDAAGSGGAFGGALRTEATDGSSAPVDAFPSPIKRAKNSTPERLRGSSSAAVPGGDCSALGKAGAIVSSSSVANPAGGGCGGENSEDSEGEEPIASADFLDFIAQCLEKAPTRRLSAGALLEHPFLARRAPRAEVAAFLADLAAQE